MADFLDPGLVFVPPAREIMADLDLGCLGQLDASAPEFQPSSSSKFNPEAPAFTPMDAKMRPDAAEFIPIGSWTHWSTPEEAAKKRPVRQMPPASEEEWETRICKREKEVSTIKALQSYRLYVEVFPRGHRSEEDPHTPDPRDRSISKRMWKWNVERWRLLLKSRCVYGKSIALLAREYMLRPCNKALDVGGLEELKPGTRLTTARIESLAIDGQAKPILAQYAPNTLQSGASVRAT
mmetsp:Transcript_91152/g.162282  ORF Transcript_91152/g.162282 Transcript_91152/m.162282 type:complete len:237 (+) Transcript_91152:88-798(+)